MKRTKRIISILLVLCMGMGMGILASVVARADDWQSQEIPPHTKTFNAKYEIIVDSWDYTEYEADINGNVHALEPKTVHEEDPYTIGVWETKVYQLENGNYRFNQLSKRTTMQGATIFHPARVIFGADMLMKFLLSKNRNIEYLQMYDSDLAYTAEFTVEGMPVETILYQYGVGSHGVRDEGFAYADAFQLSELPSEVHFTMAVTDDIPIGVRGGTLPRILDDYSFLFRGVIKFTEVKEDKRIPGTSWKLTFWNWIMYIFLFGWIWMPNWG